MIRGRLTAALALLVVPLVAGCNVLPGAKATAAPTAPPPLAAGQHTSVAFRPAITFTVPAGWTNPADEPTYFELMPTLDQNNGIHVFRGWQALSQDPTCPFKPQDGVGTSSSALVTWMRSLKSLSVTQPAMVTLGTLPATTVDVSIAPSWTQSCPFAGGLAAVPLLIDPGSPANHWVLAGQESLRLYLVDLPGGGTMIVDVDSYDGIGFPDLVKSAAPILKSFSIASQ